MYIGFGVYTYEFSSYCGDWENGKKHGWGEYKHNNGSSYFGEYMCGKKHGFGVCTFPDGSVYTGEWKEGIMVGPASYKYPDNMTFIGLFKDNKKIGKGIYTCPDNSFYQGELLNGMNKHGMVVDEPADGCHYVGCLVDGERHGLGIYFYPWDFNASQHGVQNPLVSTEKSTENLKGSVEDGVPECCDETKSARETQYFPMSIFGENGQSLELDEASNDYYSWISTRDIYKGEWQHNLRHGRGEYVKRGEYVYTGTEYANFMIRPVVIIFFH